MRTGFLPRQYTLTTSPQWVSTFMTDTSSLAGTAALRSSSLRFGKACFSWALTFFL